MKQICIKRIKLLTKTISDEKTVKQLTVAEEGTDVEASRTLHKQIELKQCL